METIPTVINLIDSAEIPYQDFIHERTDAKNEAEQALSNAKTILENLKNETSSILNNGISLRGRSRTPSTRTTDPDSLNAIEERI